MSPQAKQPWWKSAAQAGSQALGGATQSPIGNLAQNAGQFGGALQSYLQNRKLNTLKNLPMGTGDATYGGMDRQDMTNAINSPDFAPEAAEDGTIVTKPTLVMLGEHEPEAVVPLTHRPNAKVRPDVARGRNYYGEA